MTQKRISELFTDLNDRVTYIEEHGATPEPQPSENTPIIGVRIDYTTKTVERISDVYQSEPGNFNMFKYRRRCNVNDNGVIIAFSTDKVYYTDDGSNGQVMIVQPKFYYKRTPTNVTNGEITAETLLLSDYPRDGFKLHPLFYDENGNELEYVLLSAYEGGVYDTSSSTYITNANVNTVTVSEDKLSSIIDCKPQAELSISDFERLATNRGQNWHITNLASYSANQMLFMVEYANLNSQSALAPGISTLPRVGNLNFASNTGATKNFGDADGKASSTINITNNQTITYTTVTTCAITYRGMENLWGNIWKFIGGLYSTSNNGVETFYLCQGYNYENLNSYTPLGTTIPATSNWASSLSYISSDYDWVLLPFTSADSNSLLPIGDYVWFNSDSNRHAALFGGCGDHGDKVGLFNYAFDQPYTGTRNVRGARLMFIPSVTDASYVINLGKIKTDIVD